MLYTSVIILDERERPCFRKLGVHVHVKASPRNDNKMSNKNTALLYGTNIAKGLGMFILHLNFCINFLKHTRRQKFCMGYGFWH